MYTALVQGFKTERAVRIVWEFGLVEGSLWGMSWKASTFGHDDNVEFVTVDSDADSPEFESKLFPLGPVAPPLIVIPF